MGLSANLLLELAELRRAGAMMGMNKVIEIGAQQLSNSFLRAEGPLTNLFGMFGKPVPSLGSLIEAGFCGGQELQSDEAPPSQPFWEALGFEYAAIDFNGHRHSTALDLNKDAVPIRLQNRFDLAVNAGTTEHVANHACAFQVIHDLVRPGGIMIHEVPAGGMLNHGLVNYNLKFFWHLCRENKYEILALEMQPGGTAPLPDNIADSNRQFGRNPGWMKVQAEPIRDWGIFASIRKVSSQPFVTPLDIPPEAMIGSTT